MNKQIIDIISTQIRFIYKLYNSYTTKKIQKLYFYQGFEIMDYNDHFIKIDDEITDKIMKIIEGYTYEIAEIEYSPCNTYLSKKYKKCLK